MSNAPAEILDLVAAFRLNLRTYTSTAYNEAQVRAEFIDKFFACLGWDISNRANNAPQYREVLTESYLQGGAGTPASC
jgi:adenine-specific DNA-methyltransferase